MTIRTMRPDEEGDVRRMLVQISPLDTAYDFTGEQVFVFESTAGLVGFASVSIRPWAQGCLSEPCPFVEGWYVEPGYRRQGIGKALLSAVEAWCLERGYMELGSDAEFSNKASIDAHAALGFKRTLCLQFLRKRLSG